MMPPLVASAPNATLPASTDLGAVLVVGAASDLQPFARRSGSPLVLEDKKAASSISSRPAGYEPR